MIWGAGGAVMAWKLAKLRKAPADTGNTPAERYGECGVAICPRWFPASAEFYRINDDAENCWNRLTDYAKRNWEPRIFL